MKLKNSVYAIITRFKLFHHLFSKNRLDLLWIIPTCRNQSSTKNRNIQNLNHSSSQRNRSNSETIRNTKRFN